eukprot:g7573.t1
MVGQGSSLSLSSYTPGGSKSAQGNQRRKKQIPKDCFSWAEGEDCTYGDNCRFLHVYSACPGKQDHKQLNCPNRDSEPITLRVPQPLFLFADEGTSSTAPQASVGNSSLWNSKVASHVRVANKDNFSVSSLQRTYPSDLPMLIGRAAYSALLPTLPPATIFSLISGFKAA